MTTLQKGKAKFTNSEAQQIEDLLMKIRSSKRGKQLFLRKQLRDMGFYITNYSISSHGFTVEDFRKLVSSGAIAIIEHSQARTG